MSWRAVESNLAQYEATLQQIVRLVRGGDDVAAMQFRRAQAQPQRVALENTLNEAVTQTQQRVDAGLERAEAGADAAQTVLWFALALALLIGAIAGYLLNRAISGPLQETSNVLATSAAQIVATTTQQASGAKCWMRGLVNVIRPTEYLPDAPQRRESSWSWM